MKRLQKNNKGITLVALVITVIILLVLAGISIATLTGSGLFEKTRLAEQESKNAQELEHSRLNDYENKIEEYLKNNRDTNKSENTLFGVPCSIGNGEKNNPYIIVNEYQLVFLSELVNLRY